ncbi:IS3 family transposase [Streptomyces hirsutus]|uniref:IS3 family transposase n=2 Tax=Streptomyces TaxID=1883 RepID=UPI00332DAC46
MGEVAVGDPAAVVGAISDLRTEHGIPHRVACHALGVSESWFYKHRNREPTGREVRRQQLAEAVTEEFTKSGGTYGSPKIWITLVRQGWRVSVNTIAKLMAELGLVVRKVRRRSGLTRPGKRPASPDFVHRDFTAEEPDLVWCGDMTEIVTGEGKLYLATVIDLFSRRLLGYAMGARHDADLVVAALHMAAATRSGDVRGVIFHSDRGSEYTSRRFRRACRRLGVFQSMGRVGSCFDCEDDQVPLRARWPDPCFDSETSFAALCGTSPVEASSGKTQRRRLNRGGDRQANAALFRIVLSRLRGEGRSQDYLRRRLVEGKTNREIIRCLKRYVAREIYRLIAPTKTAANDTGPARGVA